MKQKKKFNLSALMTSGILSLSLIGCSDNDHHAGWGQSLGGFENLPIEQRELTQYTPTRYAHIQSIRGGDDMGHSFGTYFIEVPKGYNLTKLARELNTLSPCQVRVEDLVEQNSIKNRDLIYEGQKLTYQCFISSSVGIGEVNII